MIPYIPKERYEPITIDEVTAWGDIPTILLDIINRFEIRTNSALEFGVGNGYSTSALANYFGKVIGVDAFRWNEVYDEAAPNYFKEIKEQLKDWSNIELVQMLIEDYVRIDDGYWDLIHIDIIHDYQHTYDCGRWAVQHSECVIFHDTRTFPEVYRAVEDLSNEFGFDFYNYEDSCGLGILIKRI